MLKRNNKTCLCCGEKYTFCTSCDQYDFEPRWKAIFHNKNCKDIFNILTEYNAGNIDRATAVDSLKQCDLSAKDSFVENIKQEINELFESKEKTTLEKSERKSVTKELN